MVSSSPLNIGLIGFGRIAELVHLRTLMSLPDVVVGAVAENDEKRLKQVWQRAPQAGTFASYHDLLRDSEVEAVVICLPPAQHASAAIAAFEAGKHVYLEKPITPSLAEAQDVLSAWRSSSKLGMIGFNFRHHRLYQQLRAIVRGERYGALVGARSAFTTPRRQLPAWKERRETGGGVLLDLASHHIDLVRYLFPSPIVRVAAMEHSMHSEADNTIVNLQLASGALVQSFFAMNSVSEHRFEVYLEKAKLVVNLAQPDVLEVFEGTTFSTRRERLARALRDLLPKRLLRTPGHEPSFARALGAFAHAVRHGDVVTPDLDDGFRCLEVVLAAEGAARARTSADMRWTASDAEMQRAP